MKKIFDDERVALSACEMFYNNNMSQAEICAALNISRPTLSKLFSYARKSGIVKISIASVCGRNHYKIEEKLEKKFMLKEAIVVDSVAGTENQHNVCCGVAAQYLDSILWDGCTVGIGMGAVLANCVRQIVPCRDLSSLTFIPLVGGLNSISLAPEIHSNYLCEQLSKKYGGSYHPLFAPARVESVRTRDELMNNPDVKSIMDMSRSMDVSLLSIGAVTESNTLVKGIYFTPPRFSVSFFKENNICGDLCLQCYDRRGCIDRYDFNETVISADIRQFCRVPYSIGIAAGVQKKDAILGAIAGRFINVLITDRDCAELLLKEQD